MIEFKRNPKTGAVEAYKDGKKIDEVKTMGNEVKKNSKKETKRK